MVNVPLELCSLLLPKGRKNVQWSIIKVQSSMFNAFNFIKQNKRFIGRVLRFIGTVATLTASTFFVESCINQIL